MKNWKKDSRKAPVIVDIADMEKRCKKNEKAGNFWGNGFDYLNI